MKGRLEVVEYMPGPLRRLEIIIKCCLLLATGIIVLCFYARLNNVLEKERLLENHRQIYEAYEILLSQGEACEGEGAYEEGEGYYRKAIALLPGRQEPYLRLAGLCERSREYEKALQVLEAYPGQDDAGEIGTAIQYLKDKMDILEVSAFIGRSRPQGDDNGE